MAGFDALPPPLRRWLAEAFLPWSPVSCRRLWIRRRQAGASVEEVLAALDRAERRAMEREAGNHTA